MTPDDVVNALAESNSISPSGNLPLDGKYPFVPVNSVVRDIADLENVPLRSGPTAPVYIRDVGYVQDSSDVPTGYALVNGRRSVYINVTKRADASTLNVVKAVKAALPELQKNVPPDIHISFEFDQSPYVTRAIWGVVGEGALGATLVGLMILVFLRDWRSAIVVLLNIPLALMAAVVALWLTGQTINLMTLGGLALAIGILVDEATVEIENIHTQMGHASTIAKAVRMGNAQTAMPRLLAMVCILAVFISSFFMQGAPRAMFVPLSLAVAFSMVASYLLSSSLVPVLSVWLLRHVHLEEDHFFDRFRGRYERLLARVVAFRWGILAAYLVICGAIIWGLGLRLGTEVFPTIDTGQFRLRIRCPDGTDINRTEQAVLKTLEVVKSAAGADKVALTLGYVGTIGSAYPVNAVFQWMRGPEDAVMWVALKPDSGIEIERFKEQLRNKLAKALPDVQFSFEPADIVNQVMSFGSSTPVEVAVSGPDFSQTRPFAAKVRTELAAIPSLRDLHVVQSLDYPVVQVDVDRSKAGTVYVTPSDVARSVTEATSSSRFTAPSYWVDPKRGIGYQVQVEVPRQGVRSPRNQAHRFDRRLENGSGQTQRRRTSARPRRGQGFHGNHARRNRSLQPAAASEHDGEHCGHRPGPRLGGRVGGVEASGRSAGGRQGRNPRPDSCANRYAQWIGHRPGNGNRCYLSAFGSQLPIVAAVAGYGLDRTGGDRGRGRDALYHWHDPQHPVLHRRDHGGGRGDGQCYFAGDVRRRPAAARRGGDFGRR